MDDERKASATEQERCGRRCAALTLDRYRNKATIVVDMQNVVGSQRDGRVKTQPINQVETYYLFVRKGDFRPIQGCAEHSGESTK